MTNTPARFPRRPDLVLCGDSLLERSTGPGGLACRLAYDYSRKADVIVRGYSGYNTQHYLDLIHRHRAIDAWDFQGLIIIWLGANDAAVPAPALPAPQQHVPLDLYRRNLGAIVDLVSTGSNAVVLVTPPPVDDVAYDLHCRSGAKPTLRFLETTRQYAEAVVKVGKSRNVHVVDVFNGMLSCKNWQEFLSDGLHLTEGGYRKVFELLMETIRANQKEWMPESLLLDAPIWQEAECWETSSSNF